MRIAKVAGEFGHLEGEGGSILLMSIEHYADACSRHALSDHH
jgi:hypothetical protein